jgi:hypothetical protein
VIPRAVRLTDAPGTRRVGGIRASLPPNGYQFRRYSDSVYAWSTSGDGRTDEGEGVMSVDQQQLKDFRQAMEADDYHLDVKFADGSALATIVAGPEACAECLVPKDLMRSMLAPMLGVGAERIQVVYPVEVHSEGA